ncbi:hypothetical protein HUO13_09330 [Saccharopolyspora erythraea]|uniref:hypothetical protein n=1 Tax=Saccharopolyspora erythraea TaxID=1836 RepID=UPI001BA581C3|nr:hypothetical protein [Saccharopolyspora erythraea]QUH00996.1 hypothetical protein HUO13_09330 [Saccharopolyspora erythraea]
MKTSVRILGATAVAAGLLAVGNSAQAASSDTAPSPDDAGPFTSGPIKFENCRPGNPALGAISLECTISGAQNGTSSDGESETSHYDGNDEED